MEAQEELWQQLDKKRGGSFVCEQVKRAFGVF